MPAGGFIAGSPAKDYGGKITPMVIITCIMASSGGLIFGYDTGISGGVTTMESFLKKFFPVVLRNMADAKQNVYCVYDSEALTGFTSSLYIAGLFSSLMASRVTKAVGRQVVMLIGGALFFIGASINAAAVNIEMLIFGRILLGFGVGFTNQAAPVYLAEMAPSRWRGAFTTGFQFFIAVGVTVASLVNYATSRLPSWGWRISLGLAAIPAAILLIGAFFIPDTPSSLISRGHFDGARIALQRVRGPTVDVEPELKDLIRSIESSRFRDDEESPYRKILRRRNRHYLVMAVLIPSFQQMTGINVIAFYAPVFFRTVGFGNNPALMAAVILGAVNIGSILVSTTVVDRYGRKALFMQGGAQMIICEVAVASILAAEIGDNGEASLSRAGSVAMMLLMCAYSAGFGLSWGPLSWLVPSEIFPLEIRSAGQSISVAVNLFVTFVLTQFFLSILCHFKYGTFLFYAAWIGVMTAFVAVFLPETKGVPLESMEAVWKEHWYWKRFAKEEDTGV